MKYRLVHSFLIIVQIVDCQKSGRTADYSHVLTSPNGNNKVDVTRPYVEFLGSRTAKPRDSKNKGAEAIAGRYSTKESVKRKRRRTTPSRVSLDENCDYLGYYCLKSYTTGKVCARTMYNAMMTFKNYCMVDYVNCMHRYQVYQILHMGACFTLPEYDYQHYPYKDDYFLDDDYVVEII